LMVKKYTIFFFFLKGTGSQAGGLPAIALVVCYVQLQGHRI